MNTCMFDWFRCLVGRHRWIYIDKTKRYCKFCPNVKQEYKESWPWMPYLMLAKDTEIKVDDIDGSIEYAWQNVKAFSPNK